ncbi:MAG: hypothetical protein ACOYMK_13695 [Hyphomonadaceae bacterium]
MPKRSNSRAILEAETTAHGHKEHCRACAEAIGRYAFGGVVWHADGLRDRQIGEGTPGANMFGREAELIAERARESLVRTIADGKRYLENVAGPVGKTSGGLAEQLGTRKVKHRQPGDG